MKRRNFLKIAGLTQCAALLPSAPMKLWGAQSSSFYGLFFINIQANGGWDVTSFCDPKTNQPNAKIINNWASTAQVQTSGNLKYAPVGNNAKFFTDQAKKTLVINGVNSRTNAHTVGRIFNNSGSQKNGVAYLSALYAFEKGQGLAMPVMTSGNIVTSGLVAPTSLGLDTFQLINPNMWRPTGSTYQYLPDDDLATINALRDQQAKNLKISQYQLPKQQQQINEYYAAVFAETSGFGDFPANYSAVTEDAFIKDRNTDAIKFALAAFKSGLGVAADITFSGFDTHDHHDTKMIDPLNTLTNSLGALWHFAEQLGISDRVLVNVSSDFGRTPYYNDGLGKDHWPYTSSLIMKTGVNWTNRTVGLTDPGHLGIKINPTTLKADKVNGMDIDPSHIQHGLRTLLGFQDSAISKRFDLGVKTMPDLFNPALQS